MNPAISVPLARDAKLGDSLAYLDAFRAVLDQKTKYTILPELYDILGKERMEKFLDIFSGQTVTIPDKDFLKECVKEVQIYWELSRGFSKEKVDILITRYDIPEEKVMKLFQEAQEAVKERDGRVRRGKSKKTRDLL